MASSRTGGRGSIASSATPGGDPFIGPKLEDIARRAGARDVAVEVTHQIDTHEQPGRRAIWLDYIEDLLLSGADTLERAGFAAPGDRDALRAEFGRLRNVKDQHFTYYAHRLTCS